MSSRLIFRNLPPSLQTSTFQAHLQQPSQLSDVTLTDLKLVAKRRFAFVGYKSPEEAERVKTYFDDTFVGSGKIKVEFVDDETRAKKHAKPSAAVPAVESNKAESSKPKQKNSRALDEFMDVMKKGSDANAIPVSESSKKQETQESGVVAVEDAAESGEVDDAEWMRRRQAAAATLEQDSDKPGESLSAAQPQTPGYSAEESLILQTHRLFLRNLSFHTTPETLRDFLSPFGPITEIHLPMSKVGKSADGSHTDPKPLGTAFVKFEKAEDALTAWKQADGKTVMGRLLHVLPGRGKPGEALSPLPGTAGPTTTTANDGGQLFGKVLGKEAADNVKAKVDQRRKDESQRGLNWATLYMNSDAVASSVADRMGIKKSDILTADSHGLEDDEEADGDRKKNVSSAVKLALAETSVINETKAYFEKHGVILTRLEGTSDVPNSSTTTNSTKRIIVPRSRTILLVKNIPYGTTNSTLRTLFEPFGALKRVLVPPAGTLAVVEFEESQDAAQAFKGISYKRLGNAIVYLEKAPEGLLKDVGDVEDSEDETTGQGDAEAVRRRVEAAATTSDQAKDGDNQENEPGSTLYVKNLSFATTNDRLVSVFSSLPSFAFARVSTKPDPKNAQARLSMGFGFVGFKTRDAATKALKGLQGYKLDGHELQVKFAQRDREGEEVDGAKGKEGQEAKKGKTTKMIVKNVPFEASKKDIRDLFSAYGTLKSCRIPKKHNSGGRGFAFLDFTTRSEAEAAMEALKHTHMLGRHLVLEWSAEGDGFAGQEVDKLREKAKREFVKDGEGLPSKKRKLGLKDGKAVGQADDQEE